MEVEDEDYWNNSETTGFSFDDDEATTASSLFETSKNVQDGRKQSSSLGGDLFAFPESHSKVLPVEKLVTKRSLAILLGEVPKKSKGPRDSADELAILKRQVASQWETPLAASTIKSILLGEQYSLHLYRSLESKTKLLEEAVKSKNGNAILCVLLFLNKSLNRKLFNRLLIFQPSAVPVYLHYLTIRFETGPAVDMLLTLGQIRAAALKDFEFSIRGQQNLTKRVNNLKALIRDHFSSPDGEDRIFVENFLKYSDWQKTNKGRQAEKVSSSLKTLCCNNWSDSRESPTSPFAFTSMLQVSDRIFHWKALSSLATSQKWDELSAFLSTKGWLGGKKLKTEISPEKIVLFLHSIPAPENVIKEYFSLVDGLESKFDLARKLAYHQLAIDTLVALRDRQGLVQYQATLKPQSDDYIYAEEALNSNVKWKNK